MAKVVYFCLAIAVVAVTLGGQAVGQGPTSPPVHTVITVEKMHCAGCAKRLAAKLYAVPGVEKVQVDVEKKTLWVLPLAGQQPSPRGLWEAVEQGSDRPMRLHGPYGVFTTKPQS